MEKRPPESVTLKAPFTEIITSASGRPSRAERTTPVSLARVSCCAAATLPPPLAATDKATRAPILTPSHSVAVPSQSSRVLCSFPSHKSPTRRPPRRVAHRPKGGGMTRRYETVYIFDSALDEPAINDKLTRFHALLTKDGQGTVSNVSHWGKRTMAFKIKEKETGYDVVAEFEAAGAVHPVYERAAKLDEGVLRYLVVQAAREQPKPVVAAPVGPEEEELEEEEA